MSTGKAAKSPVVTAAVNGHNALVATVQFYGDQIAALASLGERIAQLELENAMLKGQVQAMQSALDKASSDRRAE